MKALRFYGKGDLRVEQVPEPECGPGKVKVRPVWCGICGTDLHEYLGGPNICKTTEHPITGEKVPVTFGHEFSGIVEEVGEGVDKFKVDDRVVVEPIIWCNSCPSCNMNKHNACDKGGFIGLSGWGGGLSEHIVIPADSVYKMPDNVSMEAGALVEPLAVGWHAVKISPLKEGDAVLVLGGGPIGLCVIQALKVKGAKNIIVSEVAQGRKDFAKQFGATTVLDPTKEDIALRCRELADGQGVDVVFDCAGVQAGLDSAMDALRPGGTLMNIAIWENPAIINPTQIALKEKKYQGVVTYTRGDFQEVLEAISEGKITPEGMITKKIKLDQIIEEGFGALIHDKANQVKILVDSSTA